jgi:hypothetical protein
VQTTLANESAPPPTLSNATIELTFGVSGLTVSPAHVAPQGAVQRTDGSLPEDFAAGPRLLELRVDAAELRPDQPGRQDPANLFETPSVSFSSLAPEGSLPSPQSGGLLAGLLPLDLPGLERVVDQFFATLGEATNVASGRGVAQRLAPWVVATLLAGGAAFEFRRNQGRAAEAIGRGSLRWAGFPEIVPPIEDLP